jgi:type IV pilus biogenesis protein CpaD/CtpE
MLIAQTACTTMVPQLAEPSAANPCPAWVEFPTDRHSNAETMYLGCSNAVNLRATVEDAEDLQHGRALGSANGARESIAVGEYQNGQAKALSGNGPQAPTIVLGNSGEAAK